MTRLRPCAFPAEWEPHDATWIAWPHHEPDWPGKLGPIPWVYAEIARVLAAHERVEILCHDDECASRGRGASRARTACSDERAAARRAERSRLAARLRRRPACSTTTAAVVARQLAASTPGRSTTTIERDAQVGARSQRITGLPRVEPRAAGQRRARWCSRAAASRRTARARCSSPRSGCCRRAGAQSRADARRLRARLSRLRSAFATRSGSARAASATTRTATSTTSRASSTPDVDRARRTRTIRPTTRITAARLDNLRAAAARGRRRRRAAGREAAVSARR